LHHGNSASAIQNPVVLAAKWVFLEWFAQVWQSRAAVETLWKLFTAKMRRVNLISPAIAVFRQKIS
jgi:hypothetical protein